MLSFRILLASLASPPPPIHSAPSIQAFFLLPLSGTFHLPSEQVGPQMSRRQQSLEVSTVCLGGKGARVNPSRQPGQGGRKVALGGGGRAVSRWVLGGEGVGGGGSGRRAS